MISAHRIFPIQLRLPLSCSEWPALGNKIQPSVLQFTSVSLLGLSIDQISHQKAHFMRAHSFLHFHAAIQKNIPPFLSFPHGTLAS